MPTLKSHLPPTRPQALGPTAPVPQSLSLSPSSETPDPGMKTEGRISLQSAESPAGKEGGWGGRGSVSELGDCWYPLAGVVSRQFLALSGLLEFQGWEARRSRVPARLPGVCPRLAKARQFPP